VVTRRPALVDQEAVAFLAYVDVAGLMNHRVNHHTSRRKVAAQLRELADQLERQADLDREPPLMKGTP